MSPNRAAPQNEDLRFALDLADHASPSPVDSARALKVLRAELERLWSAAPSVSTNEHPDDVAVDRFAIAMKAKLASCRAKGRSGWDDKQDCSQQALSDMLRAAVEKGDPIDVGDFCMFLQQRGESILPSAPAIEPPLPGRWHHGSGYLCSGSFRVAKQDWEAGVCSADGLRDQVFDWICATLNRAARPPKTFAGAKEVATCACCDGPNNWDRVSGICADCQGVFEPADRKTNG